MYIHKLDEKVNEFNNTYHITISMNPEDIKSSTYIEFNIKNKDRDPKFEVGDHVRVLKYKIIFAKCYTPNWSEEVFCN